MFLQITFQMSGDIINDPLYFLLKSIGTPMPFVFFDAVLHEKEVIRPGFRMVELFGQSLQKPMATNPPRGFYATLVNNTLEVDMLIKEF